MNRSRILSVVTALLCGLSAFAQQVVIDPSQIAASATNAAEQIDYMLDQLGELAHLGEQMNSMREHIDNVFGEDGIGGKAIGILEDLGTLKRLTEAFNSTVGMTARRIILTSPEGSLTCAMPFSLEISCAATPAERTSCAPLPG